MVIVIVVECANTGLRAVADYTDTFFVNIFVKTKKFVKPSSPVHIGPRSNLLSQKMVKKTRDTVPLSGNQIRYCYFLS